MKKIFQKTALSVRQIAILFSACLTLLFSISSCKKDSKLKRELEVTTANAARKGDLFEKKGINIPFQDFLDSTKNIASGSLSKLMATAVAGKLHLNSSGTANDLIVLVDSLKMINVNGHKTFTFMVKQTSAYSHIFRNLVFDIYDNKVTALLVTYTPDVTYLTNYLNGRKGQFTGKVHAEFFDVNNENSTLQIQNTKLKVNLQEMCFPISVYLGTVEVACSRSGHLIGQDCPCERYVEGEYIDCRRAHFEDVYVSANICYDIDIPTGGGTGGGGGGGTAPTPPPGYDPCPPVAVESSGLKVQKVDGETPCETPTPPYVNPEDLIEAVIKQDSLKKHFPCASKLIVDSLAKIAEYNSFIAPFKTNKKPDLVWTDLTLPWNTPIPNSTSTTYQTGLTTPNGRSALVGLNTKMLQQSSQLMIAATAIHETLHAYINYMVETNTNYNPPSGIKHSKNWMISLDHFVAMKGLPSNYSDHKDMLLDYFDKAVEILKKWDNSQHTIDEYRMIMLYGLNTSDLLALPANNPGSLNSIYNSIVTKYGLTNSAINTFHYSQLVSTTNKLPNNCL